MIMDIAHYCKFHSMRNTTFQLSFDFVRTLNHKIILIQTKPTDLFELVAAEWAHDRDSVAFFQHAGRAVEIAPGCLSGGGEKFAGL